ETIFERTDEFFEFDMEYVKLGTDVQAWDGFVQQALQGLAFDYYPDSTLSAHTTYLLEDTNWTPAYKQLGMYTFHMRWRKQIVCGGGMDAPIPLEIVDFGLSSDTSPDRKSVV